MERSPVKAMARADVSTDRKLINFPDNVQSRIPNIANTSAGFGVYLKKSYRKNQKTWRRLLEHVPQG